MKFPKQLRSSKIQTTEGNHSRLVHPAWCHDTGRMWDKQRLATQTNKISKTKSHTK